MEELGRLISKGELRLFKHLIYQNCVISLQALKKKSEKFYHIKSMDFCYKFLLQMIKKLSNCNYQL